MRNAHGVAYYMLDNGQYSGSLLFIGMDEKILDSESECLKKARTEIVAATNEFN